MSSPANLPQVAPPEKPELHESVNTVVGFLASLIGIFTSTFGIWAILLILGLVSEDFARIFTRVFIELFTYLLTASLIVIGMEWYFVGKRPSRDPWKTSVFITTYLPLFIIYFLACPYSWLFFTILFLIVVCNGVSKLACHRSLCPTIYNVTPKVFLRWYFWLTALGWFVLVILWLPIEFPEIRGASSDLESAMIKENDIVGKRGDDLSRILNQAYTQDAEITLSPSPAIEIECNNELNKKHPSEERSRFLHSRLKILSLSYGEGSKGLHNSSTADSFLPKGRGFLSEGQIAQQVEKRNATCISSPLPTEKDNCYFYFQSINNYYENSELGHWQYGKIIPLHSIIVDAKATEAIAVTRNHFRTRDRRARVWERIERAFGNLSNREEDGTKRDTSEQERFEKSEWREAIKREYQVWHLKYNAVTGTWQIAQFHGGLDEERAKDWYKSLQGKTEWHSIDSPSSS